MEGMTKERIVFVTLSLTRGGAERVICNMCNEYFRERYQVTIISLMAASPEYELSTDIELIMVDENEEQYKQGLGKRFLRRRGKLKRILSELEKRENPIAGVISFLPEPNLLMGSLSPRKGYPVIISVRNDPVREYASTVRRILMKHYYKRVDGYVFQTDQAKEYFAFSKHITECSTVIPNPIAKEFLKENQERRAGGDKEIVCVGRLEKQKDPFVLLNAFSKIAKEFPEYRLSFYGEGSLRGEMEAWINASDLTERITLYGNVSNVPEHIRNASVYVLCSVYEGMPNALMEAMALGLPCIATKCPCGGPEFLIQDGQNGVLIPVGDEEALANAMRELLHSPEKAGRLGENARAICGDLSPEIIYARWDAFIKEHRK